jgi:hypothetical protein
MQAKQIAEQAHGAHRPPGYFTPPIIKELAPAGAVIVRIKCVKAYQGSHRKSLRPRAWVSRRFGGPMANRTELQALWTVVNTLWELHAEAGLDCNARPSNATVNIVLGRFLAGGAAPAAVVDDGVGGRAGGAAGGARGGAQGGRAGGAVRGGRGVGVAAVARGTGRGRAAGRAAGRG